MIRRLLWPLFISRPERQPVFQDWVTALQRCSNTSYYWYESCRCLSWQLVPVPTFCLHNSATTTGIADASLRSVAAGCVRVETPLLHVSYESFDDDKPPIRPCVLRTFWCRGSAICLLLSSAVHLINSGDEYRCYIYTGTIHGPRVRLKTSTLLTTIGLVVAPVGRARGASRFHRRKTL